MCKKESKKITTGSSVDKIVKEKTEKKKLRIQNVKKRKTAEEKSQESKGQGGQQTPGSDVDYDLTNMNKDMVYAAFYQLMVEPDKYIGKTLCIDGLYYTGQNEKTGTYYHYSIIKDALAPLFTGTGVCLGDVLHDIRMNIPKMRQR